MIHSAFTHRGRFLGQAVMLLGWLLAETASAQMFGARPMGRPMAIRPQPGGGEFSGRDVGSLTGRERFLRDNRSRNDFVGGSQDALEGFVGSQQAIGAGRVRAATETLRPETDDSAKINRPLTPLPARGMYHPRLELSESFAAAGDRSDPDPRGRWIPSGDPFQLTVAQRLSRAAGSEIVVLRRGEQAILRGTVADRQTAERLERLISFEPEIYEVKNELRVMAGD